MSIRFLLTIVLSLSALPRLSADAQTQPANTVRTLLTSGRLASVVDMPLYFRLLRVRLPPLEQATYAGPNAVLYDLSGGLAASIGSTAQTVSEGAGTFIPAGTTTFRASAEPASFLIFMLSPAADSEKAPLSGPRRGFQ